ncbi:GTPase-activating protein BEM3 [Bienertia sinuspersici]
MDSVTLRFYHGGLFKKIGVGLKYIGEEIYYLIPGLNLDNGLRKVYTDKEVLEMAAIVNKNRAIDLYVVHGVDKAEVVDPKELQNALNTQQVEVNSSSRGKPSTSQTLQAQTQEHPQSEQSKGQFHISPTKKVSRPNTTPKKPAERVNPPLTRSMTSPQKDCSQKSTTSTHLPDTPLNLSKCYTTEKTTEAQPTPITTECKQANTTSPNTHHCNTDDSYDLYDDRPESPIPWQDLVGDYGSDSDSQDELYTPETEESSEDEEAVIAEADPHGSEFEEQIDEEIERGAEGSEGDTTDEEFQVVKDRVKGLNSRLFEIATDLQKEAAEGRLHSQRKAQSNNVVSEGSKEDNAVLSEYEDSGEDCNTPEGSDDEGVGALIRRDRKKVATDKVDFSTFQWEAGQRFPSRQDFRAAVTRFAVTQGKDLYFCVSSSKRNQRLGVKCKSGCPFKLYASWDNNSAAFIVKSINPEHTCHRTMENNRQLKSTWLADQFLEVFKARPHWPASEIIETVRRAYRVIIKRDKAYKIKYWP